MNFVSSITLAFKDAFSPGFTAAKDNIAGMRNALDEIGQNSAMTRLAADMAMMTSMTDPMRKALSNAMDQPSRIAGSLDTAFRNVQVATGASGQEMAAMRRELLSIGGQAIGGPQKVAEVFSDVAGGIADASKHMAAMSAAVALAEANQADLAMSANAVVNVMNAWNLSAENAAIAADVLTQTSLMGVGSLDDFAGSISSISALASSAGVGLDELGSSFAYVTNKGMSAGQVQKQMKGIISTLVAPSETLSGLYESLGIESGQAMIQQFGLAESLSILKEAMGGNEQAFASIIGSAEAATVALALTEDQYMSFATSFGEGMVGITAAAQGVQLESIEAKMARLDSVSQSLQAQVGQDINGIKGFFIDFKFGFLSNVVSPLMSSPVGGALSKIAAFGGMGAKSLLDFGSGAMNTAAQMTTLAANISSVGGITKLFSSSIALAGSSLKIMTGPLRLAGSGLTAFSASVKSVGFLNTFRIGLVGIGQGFVSLGKGIVGALPKMWAWIAATFKAAVAHVAAFWPVYAIIAGVAALAVGVHQLIKHWDKVSGFFVNLWGNIKGVFTAGFDWIKNLILGAPDWVLAAVAAFFPFIGIPALIIKHWDGIKSFFTNLFNDPKAVIQGFVDWVTGKVDAIVAPFRLVGDVVGGTFSKIGGFFKGLIGGAKDSGAALTDAFSTGIQSNISAPSAAFSNSLQSVNRMMPHSDAPEGPLSHITASGRALTETFAIGIQSNDSAPAAAFGDSIQSVSRMMIDSSALKMSLPEFTFPGSTITDSFTSTGEENILREKPELIFSAALPKTEKPVEFPFREKREEPRGGDTAIHIQNLYLQSEDCESVLDFARMIMHAVHRPEEAPV